MDKLTRKWWFYAILLIAQFVLLPFASNNYSLNEIGSIINTTLGNSFQVQMRDYYVYFQVISISFLLLLIVLRNKAAKVFNIYTFVSYIAFAILQNISITEKYGLSIVTINVLMFLFVAYAWLREVVNPKNDYSFSNMNWNTSWLIVLSIVAFWAPISREGFLFKPKRLFTSGSSLAFCYVTPVILTIMTLNVPKINIVTYRITSVIGVIIGLYNMLKFQNLKTVNLGIMHLPLMIISLFALIKSYRISANSSAAN